MIALAMYDENDDDFDYNADDTNEALQRYAIGLVLSGLVNNYVLPF